MLSPHMPSLRIGASSSSSRPLRGGVYLPSSVILTLLVVSIGLSVSRPSEKIALLLGESKSFAIKGPDRHEFTVEMEAGHYARVDIQRNGVDLIVTTISPDGTKRTKHENAAGPQSPMSVSLLASTKAPYVIEVEPVKKWAPAGNYRIQLEVLHYPGPQDQKRFEAETRVAEGRLKQFLSSADSRRSAITSYQQALVLWQELADEVEQANTLQFIAETYMSLGETDKCIESYVEVLKRRGEDQQARAYTLLGFADFYLNTKNSVKALEHYGLALEIFKAVNNGRGQAAALYGLGLTKARDRLMLEAVPYYKQALAIFSDALTRDRYEEARTAHALGGAYDVLGEPQEALNYYVRALEGWRETGDLGQEGNTQSSLAKLEMDRGNWQLAFETYDRALDLYKRAELVSERDRAAIQRRRASTLYGLAYTYASLGDYNKAFEVLSQSLALRQPGDRDSTLMLTCYFHALNGEPEKALEFCNQALLEQAPTNKRRSETLTSMGVARAAMNQHEQALVLYDEALKIQQDANYVEAEAITQGWRGNSLTVLGQQGAALNSYKRSREIYQKSGDVNGVAVATVGMARVERARNNLPAALEHVSEAIAAIEPLRSNATSEALRTSYFATKVDYYELYIDVSMQLALKGDATKLKTAAFEASERARARSLSETLAKARFEGELKSNPDLAALVSKYRWVQGQIQAAKSRSYKNSNQLSDDTPLAAERNQLESDLRAKYPRYAALMFPQPLTRVEVQKLLDPDTLLLEFALGEKRSYVWAVTDTDFEGYELPPQKQIEDSARLLIKHLAAGQYISGESAARRKERMVQAEAEYWSRATAFSRMLLGNIPSIAKKKNLLIVADGQLQYLPFATLPAPDFTAATSAQKDTPASSALVRERQITNLPSASVLGLLQQSMSRVQPTKSIAIFADPVYERDDSRLPPVAQNRSIFVPENRNPLRQAWRDVTDDGDAANLQRLPATLREAQKIIELVPPGSALLAVGLKASRENVNTKQLGLYRVVHFATHGILDEINPDRSGIVLSLYDEKGRFREDGYLRLKDIYQLKLPVELVVLSACRTGLGKPVRGEGLIGLSYGFIHGGARRVLSTLWKVDDDVTAELMKRFYQSMLTEGMTPAAALRAAQVSMSREPRWSNPYYWAGFILQGDPK